MEKVGLIVRGREGLRIDLDARPGAKLIIPRRAVERLLGDGDRARIYLISRGTDTDVVEAVGAAYLTAPRDTWIVVDISGGGPLLPRLYAYRRELESVASGFRSAAKVCGPVPRGGAEKTIYRVRWSVGGAARIAARSEDEAQRIATNSSLATLIEVCRGGKPDYFEIGDAEEEEAPE